MANPFTRNTSNSHHTSHINSENTDILNVKYRVTRNVTLGDLHDNNKKNKKTKTHIVMALFKLHTLCATIFRPVWFVEYHNHDMESSMRSWYVWHKVKCHCNTSRNNVFYDFFVYFFLLFALFLPSGISHFSSLSAISSSKNALAQIWCNISSLLCIWFIGNVDAINTF